MGKEFTIALRHSRAWVKFQNIKNTWQTIPVSPRMRMGKGSRGRVPGAIVQSMYSINVWHGFSQRTEQTKGSYYPVRKLMVAREWSECERSDHWVMITTHALAQQRKYARANDGRVRSLTRCISPRGLVILLALYTLVTPSSHLLSLFTPSS